MIKVTVEEYGDNPAFHREIFIGLLTDPSLDHEGHRSQDEINKYEVTLYNRARLVTRKEFNHRYGDDLVVLVNRATAALGYGRSEDKR